MTGTTAKWLTTLEWAQITSHVGLGPAATVADVIAVLERRVRAKDAVRAAGEARTAAIRACRRCDQFGWRLDAGKVPLDPAVRCDHGALTAPPAARDITAPIHERNEEL